MPLFVCDICECIDNTAYGFYWGKGQGFLKDKEKDKMALCVECCPPDRLGGFLNPCCGLRRDEFPKVKYTGQVEVLNRCSKCQKKIDNFDPCISLCDTCKN